MANGTFVIIGGGLAAARAAEGARDAGHDGPIVIVGEETQLPYERPPLSKEILMGSKPDDSATAQPQSWYDEHDVELRLGSAATGIDPATHNVNLADGTALSYEALLIATGATPRPLKVPGGDLPGVLYLRTLDESVALRSALATGGRVVVVGAGWIGLEVAAAAREAGCDVTVVEPQDAPLLGVVGPEVAAWFAGLHTGHDVRFRFGQGVEAIEAEGSTLTVLTSGHERLPADTVVVGVGVTPNVALAEAAGLDIDNGIVTDAGLRTSTRGIWAAGDVANAMNPSIGTHVRVEHWANAKNQGYAAGRSMAGEDVSFDNTPYFYTDQYDAGMEYSGHVPRDASTDVVLRGDPSSNEFMAFWLDGDTVLAGMHVNVWDSIDAVKDLVRSGDPVDRAKLADPTVDLAQVRAG